MDWEYERVITTINYVLCAYLTTLIAVYQLHESTQNYELIIIYNMFIWPILIIVQQQSELTFHKQLHDLCPNYDSFLIPAISFFWIIHCSAISKYLKTWFESKSLMLFSEREELFLRSCLSCPIEL